MPSRSIKGPGTRSRTTIDAAGSTSSRAVQHRTALDSTVGALTSLYSLKTRLSATFKPGYPVPSQYSFIW
jgi:hypothetical protein